MTTENNLIARRQKIVAVLRAIVVLAGIYQLFAEPKVGIAILLCFAAISFPAFFSRGKIKSMPLEFELILFFMVVLQLVIGETLNWYDDVPYFDKFVHFMLPFFVGFIAAMLAYTMQITGALRANVWVTFFVVVMIALGVGVIWEIIEYLCDVFLGTYLQGSLTANPLVDTMNDLIMDLVGGVFGALLVLYIVRRDGNNEKSRLRGLTSDIKRAFS